MIKVGCKHARTFEITNFKILIKRKEEMEISWWDVDL